jgi:hypothetical protein
MDPSQVERDVHGVMHCRQCGFAYNLNQESVAAESEEGLREVEVALDGVPEAVRTERPEPSVWSVNAYAAHLDQAASVVAGRVAAIATQDRPQLSYHDQDAAVQEIDGDHVPADQSLTRLRGTVERFARAVRALPAEAWERVGIHERAGEVRLSEIAHDMPHELRHHAQDIRTVGEALQRA